MSTTQHYALREVHKAPGQETHRTPTELIEHALYDKSYQRGRTYTPLGSSHTVAAFTAFLKDEHLLLLMEYKDGGCDLFMPVSEANDIEATIAAIP
jgi:hypothetical protein